MREFILTRKPKQWLSLFAWFALVAAFDYVDWKAGRYLMVAIQTAAYVGIFVGGIVLSRSGIVKIKFE